MSAEQIDLTPVMRLPDARLVYSPADRTLEKDVGGCTIRFCPATEDWGQGPGVTRVGPLQWFERRGRDGTPTVKANGAASWTASDVVAFLLGDDGRSGHMGMAGIRPLTGDPDKDARIRLEAKKVWGEKKYMDARHKVLTHQSGVEKAKLMGTEPPAYSKELAEAQNIKAEYERDGMAPIGSFVCVSCNAPFFSVHELEAHTNTHHSNMPQQAVQSGGGSDAVITLMASMAKTQEALVARLDAIESRPKRGRPRKPKTPVE